MLPLAHINAKFHFDGEIYEVEHFDIDFRQPTDYKKQPQYEIEGGQMTVHISVNSNNYQSDFNPRVLFHFFGNGTRP